jgi:hypothetical protein
MFFVENGTVSVVPVFIISTALLLIAMFPFMLALLLRIQSDVMLQPPDVGLHESLRDIGKFDFHKSVLPTICSYSVNRSFPQI